MELYDPRLDAAVRHMRQVSLRPTVKAFLTDLRFENPVSFLADDPNICKVNLPGGGINQGESLASALVRELREETDIPLEIILQYIRRGRVLTFGTVPTSRKSRAKAIWVVALPVADVCLVWGKKGQLKEPEIHTDSSSFLRRLVRAQDTRPETASLYRTALEWL